MDPVCAGRPCRLGRRGAANDGDEPQRRIDTLERPGRCGGPVLDRDPAVELLHRVDAPAPAQPALGERSTAAADSLGERRVGGEPLDRGDDLLRLAALEHDRFLAVAQLEPDVRPRQHDRAARGEELRQLRGEAEVVERARRTGLHQDVSRSDQLRHEYARNPAELPDPCPEARQTRRLGRVPPGLDEHGRMSVAAQLPDRRVEAPHVVEVRPVDVPGVDDGEIRVGEAELGPQLGPPRAGREHRLVESGANDRGRHVLGHDLEQSLDHDCDPRRAVEQLGGAQRMGLARADDRVEQGRRERRQALHVHPTELGREDRLLVVLEVHDVRTAVAADEVDDERADVLARGEGVDEVGAAAVREAERPGARLLVAYDRERRPSDVVDGVDQIRHRDERSEAAPVELGGDGEDVECAVAGEVAVADEDDVRDPPPPRPGPAGATPRRRAGAAPASGVARSRHASARRRISPSRSAGTSSSSPGKPSSAAASGRAAIGIVGSGRRSRARAVPSRKRTRRRSTRDCPAGSTRRLASPGLGWRSLIVPRSRRRAPSGERSRPGGAAGTGARARGAGGRRWRRRLILRRAVRCSTPTVSRGSAHRPVRIAVERIEPASVVSGVASTIWVGGVCAGPPRTIRRFEVVIDDRSFPAAVAPRRADGARAFGAVVVVGEELAQGEHAVGVRVTPGRGSPALLSTDAAIRVVPPSVVERPPVLAPPGDAPLIAICMATHEPDERLFLRQLESIRRQSYERLVCLIADDASSDARWASVREASALDPRFACARSDERLGFYRNFERCLTLIPPEATLVALADQDDEWHVDKLLTLADALRETGATLAYSDMNVVADDGALIAPTAWGERRNNFTDLASLFLMNTVTGAASLMRRELLEVALPFPPDVGRPYHDHWLAVAALASGELAFVDRPLQDYVQHDANVSGSYVASRDFQSGLVHAAGRLAADPLGRVRRTVRAAPRIYRDDVVRLELFARTLEARLGPRLEPDRADVVRRFAQLGGSSRSIAWLLGRSARDLRGDSTTLGAENQLVKGIVWSRLAGWRARLGL